MSYWSGPALTTLIALGVLLGVGRLVERFVPVPASIVAGTLGFLLGPSVLHGVPLDQGTLETGVYHGLGIVFVALGLQTPKQGRGGQARSMAFGISVMVALQTVVGLALALLLGLHPGFGLLLPLGFEQGPGQAMALGTSWEAAGLVDGGALGLAIAAAGFAWSILAGVPLVAWGRRGGRIVSTDRPRTPDAPRPTTTSRSDHLAAAMVSVLCVYAVTGGVCLGLATALSGAPDIAAMVWGFHFLVGSLVASGARSLRERVGLGPVGDEPLSQISGAVVDFGTTAALAAVQLAVLTAWAWPLFVVTTVGGLATLGACVVLGRMGFEEDRFEHVLLWFGMSTGTLPVGMALLRAIDPDLRSSAPSSAVFGSALSVAGVAPLILGLHPLAVAGSPGLALGLAVAWTLVLLAGWRMMAGLDPRRGW